MAGLPRHPFILPGSSCAIKRQRWCQATNNPFATDGIPTGREHGQQPLEENVHHTPSAVNIVPHTVAGGMDRRYAPYLTEVTSCLFVPEQRGTDGEGGHGLQLGAPIRRRTIAEPTTLDPEAFKPQKNPSGPPSWALAANIALPSPVRIGRTAAWWSARRAMRV